MKVKKTEYDNLLDMWVAMKQTVLLMPEQGYSADTIKGVAMAMHVFYNRFKKLSFYNLHLRMHELRKSLTRAENDLKDTTDALDDALEDNGVLKRRVDKLEDELRELKHTRYETKV